MPVALRRITPAVVQSIQVFFQVVLYAGLFIFAQYLVSWLHLPLPANLVGMILMLALIVCRILPLQWVRAGARWLLAEMLLFFVPAVVAVVNYAFLLTQFIRPRSPGTMRCRAESSTFRHPFANRET